MSWTYSFDARALRELKKLDRPAQILIIKFLDKNIAGPHAPTRLGKPLKGKMAGLWRYRTGPYRIICQIRNQILLVLVVSVGHRKDIYRKFV